MRAPATLLLAAALAAPATGQVPAGQTIDGIRCDRAEGAVFHIHQHLAIFERGRPIAIPEDVGRPASGECLYWLHTHTPDGIIHIEAPLFRTFTLGNFFDVWGQPLSATSAGPAHGSSGALRVFVDGVPYRGDPRKIELSQHTEVTVEAGPPYHQPVAFTDWQGQ